MEAATGGRKFYRSEVHFRVSDLFTHWPERTSRAWTFFCSARVLEFSFEFARLRRGRCLQQRSAISIINRGRNVTDMMKKASK